MRRAELIVIVSSLFVLPKLADLMQKTLTNQQAREELLALLREKSVSYGDFLLSSGARSKYYIDCRLTTLDSRGAWLVGQVMHELIRRKEKEIGAQISGVGGLTMGADPVALATSMFSYFTNEKPPLQTFSVRKAAKAHGQTKLIEGNFKAGDSVVVIDDVVTRGDSTLAAIEALLKEEAKIAFVAVLVDRQEGGRQKIEQLGYQVVSAFKKDELIDASRA
ncbi:MAG TPA: orotate phosphoribosyltransferase [Verrucomicrobiae bacterium]|nr:orotate phosphoribosyltransferase [Verrucomicrobiae bacterium]